MGLLFGEKPKNTAKPSAKERAAIKREESILKHQQAGGTITVSDSERGLMTLWFDEQGELHREDGPAMEFEDGSYRYYIHGMRHRSDGLAVYVSMWEDKNEFYTAYYLEGVKLTQEEFLNITD